MEMSCPVVRAIYRADELAVPPPVKTGRAKKATQAEAVVAVTTRAESTPRGRRYAVRNFSFLCVASSRMSLGLDGSCCSCSPGPEIDTNRINPAKRRFTWLMLVVHVWSIALQQFASSSDFRRNSLLDPSLHPPRIRPVGAIYTCATPPSAAAWPRTISIRVRSVR